MPTLDWIGKKAVLNHHREVPFHLLEKNDAFSVGGPDSGNIIVQGDNLLALKALLPFYAGQVKLIYIDPPYTVLHNQNNFIKYNERLFSWEDQKRLATALAEASGRGVLVLVSNADSPCIQRLYSSPEWNHVVLHRKSLLASASCNRQTTTELAIANYDLHGGVSRKSSK